MITYAKQRRTTNSTPLSNHAWIAPSKTGTRINQKNQNPLWFTNHRMTNYKPATAAFWVAP